MGEQSAGQRRYVRCGPFNLGTYAEVPTHQFKQHPEWGPYWTVEGAPPELRGQMWACSCNTIVSPHQLAAASQWPCDGRMRCAICNGPIRDHRYSTGSWAGRICLPCRAAHNEALTVRLTPHLEPTLL
jgi:hypothetical protein